jgi:lipoprotein-anchoring transpeptidase ErfK/SrfK
MVVAQPISIRFDEPVANRAAAEGAITVTTSPKVHGGLRWITDQEVRWRGSRKLRSHVGR